MGEHYVGSMIIASIIGVVGFFLKTTLKRIEDKLIDHVKNFNNLSDRVNLINLSMVKIDSSLSSIDKDLERANRRVSDINQLVMNNVEKVVEQGHEINNIKAQIKMLAKELDEVKE
jgi:peptidoglycan hydrolase CwlO-like protein